MATKKPLLSKKGLFTCSKCSLSTPFYYFGRNWPFSTSLVTLEDAYITRDPFSPEPTPLILGSHCVSCNVPVCVSPSCSIFYTKRFCINCVRENWEEFPAEIQQEVLKVKQSKEKECSGAGSDQHQTTSKQKAATKRGRKEKHVGFASPRCYIALLIGLFSILVTCWYPWKLDFASLAQLPPNDVSDPNSRSAIPASHLKQAGLEQLATLAYHGNLTAIRRLMQNSDQVAWDSSLLTTPIHHALLGRFDSLQQQSLEVLGRHEDVIEYLVGERGLNASQGCPVYYAVNFRNMIALNLLLKASDVKSSVLCLTTQDTDGVTALHVAVESKASGFARFFAKLGNSDPGKDMCTLLGVRPLKATKHPGILTLQQLNAALPPRDLELVLMHTRSALNLTEVRDGRGNSLLHSAVYGGRLDVVELLLKEGVPPDVTNLLKMTPLHLAYAGHFCEVAQMLLMAGANPSLVDIANRTPLNMSGGSVCDRQVKKNLPPPQDDPPPPGDDPPPPGDDPPPPGDDPPPPGDDPPPPGDDSAWNQYLGSGWYSGLLKGVGWRCDLPVRDSAITATQFVTHHAGAYSPVLIRGLIRDWPAWDHWSYEQLLKRYGSLLFTVSDVPYAQLYHGRGARTRRTTLLDFVASFRHEDEYPDYLFDGQVLHRNAVLAGDAPLPAIIANFSVTLKQLIIGPKASGSPPHFHNHALNALVYGVKKWYLWPPREAHFIFGHVGTWAKNRTGDYLECVQMPGDVIYVPQNWGHAVINEAPSIAVAFEFKM